MTSSATLAELAWLEGVWIGEGLGGEVRETYSPPAGGQMVGHFRLLRDSVPIFYELIVVTQVGASLEYRVKHFDSDLRGWERQDAFDCFKLVASEPNLWTFDKAMIRRTGPDSNKQAVRADAGQDWSDHFKYRRA